MITGRCYCGAITITASEAPSAVVYCHCSDCRRATGAPVAAFAAFDEAVVTFSPNEGQKTTSSSTATRSFCGECGSPLSGRYAYLPGQVYVALGVLDQAHELAPQFHAHDGERLPWLRIEDDLERISATARRRLSSETS